MKIIYNLWDDIKTKSKNVSCLKRLYYGIFSHIIMRVHPTVMRFYHIEKNSININNIKLKIFTIIKLFFKLIK